jgi:DNA polymerase-3 subunit epsilon
VQIFTHGIFLDKDENGFSQLKIHPLDWPNGELILKFASKAIANKILGKIIKENNLHALFAMRSKMKEKGIDVKVQNSFNTSLEKAARKFLYKNANFFIISTGIHPDEHSVIWIENSVYKGFGYFNPELTEPTPSNLKEVIRHDDDDIETQKIIRTQMRKLKNSKIISY